MASETGELAADDESDIPALEGDIDEAPYETAIERKVLIQPYDYAVRTLMDMVIEGDLILDPDYQRNYRWPDEKASRFIESIALNIPVPVFYFAEEADGKFSVIDGQQRLTSLFRYMKPKELSELFKERGIEELVLSGLKVRPDLNGKKYLELSAADRSVLAKRPMRCIVVLNESDDTLKFEVFERLNTGSSALTDQEVRNCLYRGGFNDLVKELATYEKFQSLISLPATSKKNMKDAELVVRFLAYRDFTELTKYSDNYTEYLNKYMEDNREVSAPQADKIRGLFTDTIDLIYDQLGPGVAFRKPLDVLGPSASRFAANINGSIYESQMVAVSRAIEGGAPVPSDLRDRVLSVFADGAYVASVLQGGTVKRSKVLTRTKILSEALN